MQQSVPVPALLSVGGLVLVWQPPEITSQVRLLQSSLGLLTFFSLENSLSGGISILGEGKVMSGKEMIKLKS